MLRDNVLRYETFVNLVKWSGRGEEMNGVLWLRKMGKISRSTYSVFAVAGYALNTMGSE